MLRRSEWRSLNPARDAAAKFLAFVREHYLFVDAVPQAYIDASFGRAPQAGQHAKPDGVSNRRDAAVDNVSSATANLTSACDLIMPVLASEPGAEAPVNLNGLSAFNPAIAAKGSAPSTMPAVAEKKVGS